MHITSKAERSSLYFLAPYGHWGMFWLLTTTALASYFFLDGLYALADAWTVPEYSHGPFIPVISLFLFLRQLKEYPEQPGHTRDPWIGFSVIGLALVLGALGRLANIADIVAYATIVWVGGLMLVSFGWAVGRHFWPPVLHLVYMLPLPGVLYYKLSAHLQLISSELGVQILRLFNVPVFLEGNIIDLGVLQLHVAEACSGLSYLFPILSFSYIFAVIYRGPTWHKAILLVAAAPITVFMNSVRIAAAGVIAQYYGVEWLEGFTHFFEGWVIFIICIALLFLLAWMLIQLRPGKIALLDALDMDTDDLGEQAARVRHIVASPSLIGTAALALAGIMAFQLLPERGGETVVRERFVLFPQTLGEWHQVGAPQRLAEGVQRSLGADDYHGIDLARSAEEPNVSLFMAWYEDQSQGGVHSPEICLPGSGWEIAWLERSDIADSLGVGFPFNVNRAIIQKSHQRVMAYYWFQQGERRIASDFAAKFYLLLDGILTGSTDGALIRLTTVIQPGEDDNVAEARLINVLQSALTPLPRFIPDS